MSNFVINPAPCITVPVKGGGDFPVRRIFCIGKNYVEHAIEMGGTAETKPIFFMKPAEAIAHSGQDIPFPADTENLHYEGEMVIALESGGSNLTEAEAIKTIYGFAAGCDLTKRDIQKAAKDKGAPWEVAKSFDNSAVMGAITPAQNGTDLLQGDVTSYVNDQQRQAAPLASMTLKPADMISILSQHFTLYPGDLIFTGTPAGVGKLVKGDMVKVSVTGCDDLIFRLG